MRDIGFGILGAILLVVSLVVVAVIATNGPATPAAPTPSATAVALASMAPGPDQRDADFLTALGGQVTSVTPYNAQLMGHRVCTALDEGTPVPELRKVLRQKGLTDGEASRIILAAVTMYCAENHDKVIQ